MVLKDSCGFPYYSLDVEKVYGSEITIGNPNAVAEHLIDGALKLDQAPQ